MVVGAVLVYLADLALKLAVGEMLIGAGAAAAAGNLRVHVGIDKDAERLVHLKYRVRAAPDDHAVALFGEPADYLVLDAEQLGSAAVDEIVERERVGKRERVAVMQTVVEHVLNITRVHFRLLGDRGNDLAVVIFNAERVGKTLADLAPAAAELTADCDYTHMDTSFM